MGLVWSILFVLSMLLIAALGYYISCKIDKFVKDNYWQMRGGQERR